MESPVGGGGLTAKAQPMTKAIFTDSMLLVSKRGVKSLALALTPKETTVLAYYHQMRGANNFLVWIQMQ